MDSHSFGVFVYGGNMTTRIYFMNLAMMPLYDTTKCWPLKAYDAICWANKIRPHGSLSLRWSYLETDWFLDNCVR